MNDLGKTMVVVGLLLVGVGIMLWLGFGKNWLGRLPGDIHYTKGNFSFYFPCATCMVASLILSVIIWLLRK